VNIEDFTITRNQKEAVAATAHVILKIRQCQSWEVSMLDSSERRFFTIERKMMCLVYWQFPPLLVKNLRAFAALYETSTRKSTA